MNWTYKVDDFLVIKCGRNYNGLVFPKTEEVPEKYRGKIFTARFGQISIRDSNQAGFLVIETEGLEPIVLDGEKFKNWTDEQKRLHTLVEKLVPRGL